MTIWKSESRRSCEIDLSGPLKRCQGTVRVTKGSDQMSPGSRDRALDVISLFGFGLTAELHPHGGLAEVESLEPSVGCGE